MKKKVTLKDGSQVMIRSLKKDDVKKSIEFFKSLPSSDRIYLRSDVTNPKVVRNRIRDLETHREKALIALDGDQIVADGSLELEIHGWKEHLGEIRLVVARPYQRKGLGLLIARELYFIAASQKVEEIIQKSIQRTELTSYLALEPTVAEKILAEIREASESVTPMLETTPVLLASPLIRMYLRKLTDRFLPDLVVLSHSEIVPTVQIRTLRVVTLNAN